MVKGVVVESSHDMANPELSLIFATYTTTIMCASIHFKEELAGLLDRNHSTLIKRARFYLLCNDSYII